MDPLPVKDLTAVTNAIAALTKDGVNSEALVIRLALQQLRDRIITLEKYVNALRTSN